MTEIRKNLDLLSSSFENFVLLGNLNAEARNKTLKDFCQVYNCTNIITDDTCFKDPQNTSCMHRLDNN